MTIYSLSFVIYPLSFSEALEHQPDEQEVGGDGNGVDA
jgi:hypothetical protein